MPEPCLTLREVAELLSLAEKSTYRLAQSGSLPGFKAGGSWRFRQKDIDTWMRDGIRAAQTPKGQRKTRTTPTRRREKR
jgi:excisionase family DNA binding protein